MTDDDDPPNVISLTSEGQTDAEEQAVQEALFLELANLQRTNPAKYYGRKKEVSALLGIPMGVIDAQVGSIEKALKANTNTPDDDTDTVAEELFGIGVSRSTLWHNADHVAYASFQRDGHLEHHQIKHYGYQDFLKKEYGKEYQKEIGGVLYPTYPSSKSMKEATDQLESYARIDG
jgi:hypothetical protein